MAEDSVKRKLKTILCADVKIYNHLIGEDEIGIYPTLTSNLKPIRRQEFIFRLMIFIKYQFLPYLLKLLAEKNGGHKNEMPSMSV